MSTVTKSLRKKAIAGINKNGLLLVFPKKEKKVPLSLWSYLYPRSKMVWEWDADGDGKVFGLWHLMKEVAGSGDVVYSKWFQDRATFFSKPFFQSLLSHLRTNYHIEDGLTEEAEMILELLRSNSPLSTREIKKETQLQGKLHLSLYTKAVKQLFQRGLVVGFGEIEDGSFPSSLIGATDLLFEDIWKASSSKKKVGLPSAVESSPDYKKFFDRFSKKLVSR